MRRQNQLRGETLTTTHHIWPQHVFRGVGPTIELCISCHKDLTRIIESFERCMLGLYRDDYYKILNKFLMESEEENAYTI